MRMIIRGSLLAVALWVLPTSIAAAANAPLMQVGPSTTQSLAVFGDEPYGTSSADTSQFVATPAFIDSINADRDVQAVLQVGDIHSGKQYCTQAYDQSIFALWTRFADPLIYTPGDNEWADCHKAAEGGGTYNATTGQIDYLTDANGSPVDYANGNPVANLALIRSIFFPQPGVSLGSRKKLVLSQSSWARLFDRSHPSDAQFVENVIWVQGRTLFVTINLPGGSNNETDPWYGAPTASYAQAREVEQRTRADLRWLDLAYAIADADHRIGSMVIGAQADMWDPEKGAAHQAAYEPFVGNLARHTAALGKPVLMFNGDSHIYQSGNPLSPSDPVAYIHPGYDVPNFHRVVVHGSTVPLEWLKLTIGLYTGNTTGIETFGPFSWQRMVQP
jgi:hypothetical protein